MWIYRQEHMWTGIEERDSFNSRGFNEGLIENFYESKLHFLYFSVKYHKIRCYSYFCSSNIQKKCRHIFVIWSMLIYLYKSWIFLKNDIISGPVSCLCFGGIDTLRLQESKKKSLFCWVEAGNWTTWFSLMMQQKNELKLSLTSPWRSGSLQSAPVPLVLLRSVSVW